MGKKSEIIYQAGSETIRQQPENYQIAVRVNGRWYSDPDLACNKKLAVKVFLTLFNVDLLYGRGEEIIKAIYS